MGNTEGPDGPPRRFVDGRDASLPVEPEEARNLLEAGVFDLDQDGRDRLLSYLIGACPAVVRVGLFHVRTNASALRERITPEAVPDLPEQRQSPENDGT